MSTTRAAAMAIATALALTACTSTNDPPPASTTSEPTTSTTTDYKDEAVEAAKAWIEDDAGRLTSKNATPEQVQEGKQFDRALKKAGIKVTGHDSVVSAEVDRGLTNTTDVVIAVCVTTDQKLMKGAKNVRTDAKGKAVEPGDRALQTVEMHRDVGAEDWLVSGGRVRELPC